MEAEQETSFLLPLGSDELGDFHLSPLGYMIPAGLQTPETQHEVSSQHRRPNIPVLQALLFQYRPGGQQTLGADTVPFLLSPST